MIDGPFDPASLFKTANGHLTHEVNGIFVQDTFRDGRLVSRIPAGHMPPFDEMKPLPKRRTHPLAWIVLALFVLYLGAALVVSLATRPESTATGGTARAESARALESLVVETRKARAREARRFKCARYELPAAVCVEFAGGGDRDAEVAH